MHGFSTPSGRTTLFVNPRGGHAESLGVLLAVWVECGRGRKGFDLLGTVPGRLVLSGSAREYNRANETERAPKDRGHECPCGYIRKHIVPLQRVALH